MALALTRIVPADVQRLSAARDTSKAFSAELRGPLPLLLASGGDTRLAIDPVHKSNVYGCYVSPSPLALAFASSTATSISERAYQAAHKAREALIGQSAEEDLIEAFDWRIECVRHELRSRLELDHSGAEVVFSPSGTDSQLHALFFARQLMGGPITCIVVGADQTGSGTAFTSCAQHFSDRTAQGRSVTKGTAIAELADDTVGLGISLFAEDGSVRSAQEIDTLVIKSVAEQVRTGSNVILLAMDSSKLGWRAPSDACLRMVSARWPEAVQIVVDACQMRIGRPRLREYLNRGYIVLVTGSKFFSGPAFSGASLWPRALAERIARMNEAPEGLEYYATQFDLPLRWGTVRASLPSAPNFGQWLRWEAALEEMRAYHELPSSYRRRGLAGLAGAVPAAIAASRHLEALPCPEIHSRDWLDDAEMSNKTIFPFLVRRKGHALGFDEMTRIYRALNSDLSATMRGMAKDDERALASVPCHVGQPVKTPAGTVLRIAIGATILSEAWSHRSHTAEANIRTVIGQIETVIKKIDLIVATNSHLARPI
jgi:hypothetical protein